MIRIAVIGDYNSKFATHVAINTAVEHTAAGLGLDLRAEWVPTPELTHETAHKLLSQYDAVWASPGSPYQSGEGMLRGIEFARANNVPFTAT